MTSVKVNDASNIQFGSCPVCYCCFPYNKSLVNILQKKRNFCYRPRQWCQFFANQIFGKILTRMTWLGEIGKIYRDSVENLRENMHLRSKFCVCVSILDSATDLSGCSQPGSL